MKPLQWHSDLLRRVIFCLGVFVGTNLLAEEEAPKLKMADPMPHSFTYSPIQDGTLYTAYLTSDSNDEIRAALIWKPRGSGKLVDIGTLSSLDYVLRGLVARLGTDPARKEILAVILRAISEYVQLQSYGQILFFGDIEDFLSQVKPRVPNHIYENLRKRLVYPADEWNSDPWVISFFVLKSDGAVELNRFFGSIKPFSISKRETEIIAGVGVVPKFDFLSKVDTGSLNFPKETPPVKR